jgi:hypothetical protein
VTYSNAYRTGALGVGDALKRANCGVLGPGAPAHLGAHTGAPPFAVHSAFDAEVKKRRGWEKALVSTPPPASVPVTATTTSKPVLGARVERGRAVYSGVALVTVRLKTVALGPLASVGRVTRRVKDV